AAFRLAALQALLVTSRESPQPRSRLGLCGPGKGRDRRAGKGMTVMYPRSVHALQADALFASALQRSDELTLSQIRRAITAALDGYGVTGCAGPVAHHLR